MGVGRSKDHVNTLANGLAVLRAFGQARENLTISQVAARVGLTSASARRILLTLTDLGYLKYEAKRFAVAPKVLDLGYAYLSSRPIWQIAQPVLERLSSEFKVSSSAAVLDGTEVIFIVRAPFKQISRVLVSTGTRQPAHVTALGRVLMASLEKDKLDEVISHIDFFPFTPYSVMSGQELTKILDTVRKQKYALVDQEMEFGLRAVAVPIYDRNGRVVAAMNAAGNVRSHRIENLVGEVVPVMFEASAELSAQIA